MKLSNEAKVTGEMLCDSRLFTNRESMLLPNSFVPSLYKRIALDELIDDLRRLGKPELVEVIESLGQSLDRKLAAGKILGISGDTRINTLEPQMISVIGNDVKLGLPYSEVAEVTGKYKYLGVQETWIKKECPVYEISIESFKIGRFPITNKEYRDFLIDTKYEVLPSSWKFGIYPFEKSNHPVYSIDIDDARAYVKWLSSKTGREFFLPTEAEWEYAAAGVERNVYPWGNSFDKSRCNSIELELFDTTPVGVFISGRSWCGALDLSGNVEEIVDTTYHSYNGGEVQIDHLNENGNDYYITRGGCFSRFEDLTRCKRRHGNFPSEIFPIGFRIVERTRE